MEKQIKYLKGWFLSFILAIVVCVIAGAVLGAIVGFILGMAQVSAQAITTISGILGLVLGGYSSFYFYRWSIIKFILPQAALVEK